MQYWNKVHPCIYCRAKSNTTHATDCKYYQMYSKSGSPLPPGRVPLSDEK